MQLDQSLPSFSEQQWCFVSLIIMRCLWHRKNGRDAPFPPPVKGGEGGDSQGALGDLLQRLGFSMEHFDSAYSSFAFFQ